MSVGTAAPGDSSAAHPRRFCRFRTEAGDDAGLSQLPRDGMCLSAFLIVRAGPAAPEVLWGRPDVSADWGAIGALDHSRIGRVVDRWMLPSCHLELFESPSDAVRRIAREQLDAPGLPVEPVRVFSEAYGRADRRGIDPHWDLHFVSESIWPAARPLRAPPWTELRFARPQELPPGSIARGHDDILALLARPA